MLNLVFGRYFGFAKCRGLGGMCLLVCELPLLRKEKNVACHAVVI